jgi:endoglucanase
VEEIIELHTRLLAKAAPPGHENALRAEIEALAGPYTDEIRHDPMGNLIFRKQGDGVKIMLSAHCDVLGFLVCGVNDDGLLSIRPLGGHIPYALHGLPVRFPGGQRGTLVLADIESAREKEIRNIAIKEDVRVDIGAENRAEAQTAVRVGDVCVFDGEARHLRNSRYASPYCDDLIGCAVLLSAMRKAAAGAHAEADVYYVFSAQEEMGVRGAGAAAHAISPDIGIAVDVCSAGDSLSHNTFPVALGGGPAVDVMDDRAISSPLVLERLQAAAAEIGARLQYAAAVTGGTDASAIQKTGAGVHVASVCVPTRGVHSFQEMIDAHDAGETADLLAAFIGLCAKERPHG